MASCFVDFKKAFDLVWHEDLWAALKSYGIGKKQIKILQNERRKDEKKKRRNRGCKVNGELSEWF